jgi:leucyl aminopeptidase (aminopeptidase T)
MYRDFARILNSARLKLEAFDVKPGENLAILASSATLPALLEAYFSAAVTLGAEPVLVTYKARDHMSELPAPIVPMLMNFDAVADLHSLTWTYSQSLLAFHSMIKERGIRYRAMHLMGSQEAELNALIAAPPDAEVAARTLHAQKMIDAATTIRISSDLGTDLTVPRGTRPSTAPQGEVAFFPPENGANGLIRFIGVVQSIGPVVFTKQIYAPVDLRIVDGRIVEISGDSPDSPMLEMWFRSIRDPNIYQLAHVNLGVDQRMLVHNRDDFSVHVSYGGVAFGVGANMSPNVGGTVDASGHIEMQMVEADFWIDDVRVLEHGEFTPDSGLAAPGR